MASLTNNNSNDLELSEGPRQRIKTEEAVDVIEEINLSSPAPQLLGAADQSAQQVPLFVSQYRLPFEIRDGPFLYNTRIFFLIAFSLAPILAMAGKYSLTLLVTGLLAVYVLDFLSLKRWTLVAFWGALSSFWVSIYLSNILSAWFSFFNMFTIMHGSMFVMLVGIWGSMQSSWFRSWSPELGVVCERILFAALPVVCVPLLISMCVALVGIRNAPFYLSIIMCGILHWFAKPERSSFKVPSSSVRGGHNEEDLNVQKKIDGILLVISSMLIPVAMYIGVYHRLMGLFDFHHWLNILVLISIPFLMVVLSPMNYLWWFHAAKGKNLYVIRLIAIAGAVGNMVLWIEYRVIFERYPHMMAIPSPWNYILVTMAAYAMIGLVLLILMDQLGKSGRVIAIILSTLIVSVATTVVGFPFWFISLPAVATFSAASFYFSKSWKHYAIFGVCSILSIGVWLARSFWFLDYEFEFTLLPINWSVSLAHALFAIMLLAALSVAIVPAMLIPELKRFAFIILVSHGAALGWLEQLLYEQGEGFYSLTLVFLTTGLGLYLASCLHTSQRLTSDNAAFLMAIYLGKLGILLAPMRMALLATFITSVTITRLYLAYQQNEKLSEGMCWAYVVASGVTLFITRRVIIGKLLYFFMDTRFYEISESRILGALLLLWGAQLIPLTYNFNPKNKILKRLTLILLVSGTVWSLWQPSFSASGAELLELSTETSYHAPWWSAWVIMGVMLAALIAYAAPKRYSQSIQFRLAITTIISIGLGLAFCGTYLWFAPIPMYLLICSTFSIIGFILYSTHYPFTENYQISFMSYSVALFLVLPSIGLCFFVSEDAEVVRSALVAVIGVHITLQIFLAILIKFKISGQPLYRFKTSKKLSRAIGHDEHAEQQMPEELAVISNLACISAYMLTFCLIAWLSWKNYLAYLIISPALLLLSKDKYLFTNLTDNHRYTMTMLLSQLLALLFFVLDYASVVLLVFANPSGRLVFKAVLTLLAWSFSLPSHIFSLILMYTLKKPNPIVALVCVLLSLLACVVAPFDSVLYNGLVGVMLALLQLFTSAQWIPISVKEQFMS